MNFNNFFKKINKNYLLLFLIVLVGFVLIDCNTKMFSKLVEGQSCGNGNNNGSKVVSSIGCGRGCDKNNPTNCAKGTCDAGSVNGLGNSNSNGKSLQGYSDEKMYVSAKGPLGREVPKTLQNDYSTLKSFGLTNLKDVVNYIPGDGPSQFVTGNRNNNNAAGKNSNNSVGRNNNNSVGRNNNNSVGRNNNNSVGRNNNNSVKNNNNSVGRNNNNSVKNNNNNCKPIVYGADWCGWTKKQKKYMADKGIDYTYVDCAKDKSACPPEVKGFPAIKHCDGTLKPGYQEL
jgi:hypothetical protein